MTTNSTNNTTSQPLLTIDEIEALDLSTPDGKTTFNTAVESHFFIANPSRGIITPAPNYAEFDEYTTITLRQNHQHYFDYMTGTGDSRGMECRLWRTKKDEDEFAKHPVYTFHGFQKGDDACIAVAALRGIEGLTLTTPPFIELELLTLSLDAHRNRFNDVVHTHLPDDFPVEHQVADFTTNDRAALALLHIESTRSFEIDSGGWFHHVIIDEHEKSEQQGRQSTRAAALTIAALRALEATR